MKVDRIRCFAPTMAISTGHYEMSHDRVLESVDTTVVELTADDGTTAYAEVCTLGTNYIDGFAAGAQAAVELLAPVVHDVDIMAPGALNARMDAIFTGNRTAKAVVDDAFWDLRGKLLGLPVCDLIGGRQQQDYAVFDVFSLDTPEAMAAEVEGKLAAGTRAWQLKLGGDPLTDAKRVEAVCEALGSAADFVTCDANTGWTRADATRFLRALPNVDVYVEQPCPTLEDLADLRSRTLRPFVADEVIVTVHDLMRCFSLGAADAINLKPTRVGGLTKAVQIRDLATSLGIKVMVDEPFGGELAVSVIAQVSSGTQAEYFLAASHVTSTHISREAQPWLQGPGVPYEGGRASAPDLPGLGIGVNPDELGTPVFDSWARR